MFSVICLQQENIFLKSVVWSETRQNQITAILGGGTAHFWTKIFCLGAILPKSSISELSTKNAQKSAVIELSQKYPKNKFAPLCRRALSKSSQSSITALSQKISEKKFAPLCKIDQKCLGSKFSKCAVPPLKLS